MNAASPSRNFLHPPRGKPSEFSEDPLSEPEARKAILALEDGRIFHGRAAGAVTRRGGEVVFNTSLTGYQEVFTDPSYAGQIVCLTYPHIGNVGTNPDDEESGRPYIESLIVREFSAIASNWRSGESAQKCKYLVRHNIPVLWDVDTRALVLHIRKMGALRGVVSTDGTPAEKLLAEARALPSMAGLELASRVSAEKSYTWEKGSIELTASPWQEAMRGTGCKRRAEVSGGGLRLRHQAEHSPLARRFRLRRAPCPGELSADDVMAMKPDGVFLSNGPGDPEPATYGVENIRELLGRVRSLAFAWVTSCVGWPWAAAPTS